MSETRMVTLEVVRFRPEEDDAPTTQTYEVPCLEDWVVLDALNYIKDESLTLTEISYLLGFAEPSSFSRAYKGWTGISPTTARSTEAA